MSFDFIAVPTLAVNGFLWDTMQQIYNANIEENEQKLADKYDGKVPFYPIGDSAAGDEPWDKNPYFIYDRVFRFSSKPFYEHKRENTLYYLKAREIDSLEWSSVIQTILDREDDAAKDINDWIRAQEDGNDLYPVYFHNIRVYQSRSSSPSSDGKIREFSTIQPYYISEFMVDMHFHFTKQLVKTPRLDDQGDKVYVNGLLQYDYSYERVAKEYI
jgi:hypothetical protein